MGLLFIMFDLSTRLWGQSTVNQSTVSRCRIHVCVGKGVEPWSGLEAEVEERREKRRDGVARTGRDCPVAR